MTDAAVPENEVSLPPERGTPVSETEWLEKKRRERAAEPEAKEPESEPSEEVEPETEPEGDPDPVREPEDEADDATSEDGELLAEAEEAEPSEETEDFLSGTVSLEELAEGLEVDPEDLADHVQVTVTSNGKADTVSLAELKKGYAREADYTRQKMELAEREREFDATSQKAIERHNASVQQLDAVAMMLAQEIDTGLTDEQLARLKEEDPVRWSVENDTRNRKLQAFNAAMQQRRQLDAKKAEETRNQAAEYRTKQQNLLKTRMPEMADPKKVAAFESDVGKYLTKDIGYTDQEVMDFFGGPWDARQIQVLADAAKYRASQSAESKAKKKIKKLPKVSKTKARRTQKQQESDKMRSARARVRSEQSQDAWLDMMKEKRRLRRNASDGGSKPKNYV